MQALERPGSRTKTSDQSRYSNATSKLNECFSLVDLVDDAVFRALAVCHLEGGEGRLLHGQDAVRDSSSNLEDP